MIPKWWPLARSIILFFTGLLLIVQEAQRKGVERPTLLFLYAAMIGLPAFFELDRGRRKDDDDEK